MNKMKTLSILVMILLLACTIPAFAKGEGAGITVLLCSGLIGLASLGIYVYMIYWVYMDCKKREDTNMVLWVVLTAFMGIFGLIIYLLAGRKKA